MPVESFSARGVFRATCVFVVGHVKDTNLRERSRATFSFGKVPGLTWRLGILTSGVFWKWCLNQMPLYYQYIPIRSDRFWDIDFDMQHHATFHNFLRIRCVKLQSMSSLMYNTYFSIEKGRIKQRFSAVPQLSHPCTGTPNLANRMRQLRSCWHTCDTPTRFCNFADELAEELEYRQSWAFVGLKSEQR